MKVTITKDNAIASCLETLKEANRREEELTAENQRLQRAVDAQSGNWYDALAMGHEIAGLTAERDNLQQEVVALRGTVVELGRMMQSEIDQLTAVRDELLTACEEASELIGGMAVAGSPWGSLPVLERLHAAIAMAKPQPPMASHEIDQFEEGLPLTDLQLRRIAQEEV